MLTITVEVDAPLGSAESAKEVLAMAMEAVGIVRVVDIRESRVEQASLFESNSGAAPALPASSTRGPGRESRRVFLETILGLYSSGVLVDPEQEQIYRAELEALREGGENHGEKRAAVQR